MTDVKSKNLYELLGNTSDQDSDREPAPPTKAIDKTNARSGKREAPKQAPVTPANNVGGGRGGRQARGDRTGGFNSSENAFRDRATGRERNRQQEVGGDASGEKRRERGRGRGGPRRGGDRHSRTAVSDHQKQVGHGWGEQTGDGEWADEKAGDAQATQERKEAAWDADKNETWTEEAKAVGGPDGGQAVEEAEPEPEDTSKSYADYLAEKAAQKLEGLGVKEARAPNEGAREDKKWKGAKELVRAEGEDYFKGEERARRERDRGRNAKEFVDIDYSFKEQSRDSRGGARGGRGRGRGGDRGGDRGDFRGRGRGGRGDHSDRGDRGDRAERGDRGERGGRGGRGDRGGEGFRGGRGARGGPIAVNDQEAFPSLGGK